MEIDMNTVINNFILIMILGLMVTSCSEFGGTAADELEGTKWNLLTIRKSIPIPDSIITLELEDDEVRGTSGCNTYFGEYKSKGNKISFGVLAATEMACLNPKGIMEQEQEYLSFLSEIVAYSIEGDRLILKKTLQDQLTFEMALDN